MSDNTAPIFDLFLVHGPNGMLAADSLGAPPLSPEVAQLALLNLSHTPPPCVLEVALPKRLAWELMGRLGALGATGDILEVAYRAPRISLEEARDAAEQALANWLATGKSTHTYEPMRYIDSLTHGKCRWWVFFARSPEAQEQGYIPGGAMLYVDKVDGRVWTSEDLNLIGFEWDRLLYLFPDWRER